jgi:hypothetical protein
MNLALLDRATSNNDDSVSVPVFKPDNTAHLLLSLASYRTSINDPQVALPGHYLKPRSSKYSSSTVTFGLVELTAQSIK